MLNRKGVSLVELVVAMALFAIVVPSLYYALESAMRLNLFSDTKSDVTYTAQSELEDIQALSADNTLTTVFGSSAPLYYSTTCNTRINYCKDSDGYHYEVVVTDAATSTSLKSVLLTVSKSNARVSLQLYLKFKE